jgi:8-oxo-dGTP diphosphatase
MNMKTEFYGLGGINNERLDFAVICAAYKGKWIFVRHRDRNTWEIPGGHREEDEDINATAARELYEETGATDYDMEAVCDYSVTRDGKTTFGRVFHARVRKIGSLPETEIGEVIFLKDMPDSLTYPEIQPLLYKRVLEHLKCKVRS